MAIFACHAYARYFSISFAFFWAITISSICRFSGRGTCATKSPSLVPQTWAIPAPAALRAAWRPLRVGANDQFRGSSAKGPIA